MILTHRCDELTSTNLANLKVLLKREGFVVAIEGDTLCASRPKRHLFDENPFSYARRIIVTCYSGESRIQIEYYWFADEIREATRELLPMCVGLSIGNCLISIAFHRPGETDGSPLRGALLYASGGLFGFCLIGCVRVLARWWFRHRWGKQLTNEFNRLVAIAINQPKNDLCESNNQSKNVESANHPEHAIKS